MTSNRGIHYNLASMDSRLELSKAPSDSLASMDYRGLEASNPWKLSEGSASKERKESMMGDISEMKKRALENIDAVAEEIKSIARKLHEKPEVAFEEHFASSLLSNMLEEHGFFVERKAAGLDTAFVAEHPQKSEGERIALLAEYDALPGIGHACGHNLIAAASFGAAVALGKLKEELEGELPGVLKLLGTPAEEGGSGKSIMIEGSCFDDVDVAMMFHPAQVNVCGSSSLAIDDLTFKFKGRAAHASSSPEEGINALDGVIATFNSTNALRQHMRESCRIHGIIKHGGERPNIVPEYAEAQFYVRAESDEILKELRKRVEDCAHAGALSSGAELTIERDRSCKALKEDEGLKAHWKKNMDLLGLTLDEEERRGMGSTDMGDVSAVTRAIHPYISIVPKGEDVEFHTKELARAAGSDYAMQQVVIAAKLLAMTALDCWQESSEG